jgi:hypothetical protein
MESSIYSIVTKDGNAEQQTQSKFRQDIQDIHTDCLYQNTKQEPNDELLDLFNEIIGSQLKRIKKTPYVAIKLSITGLYSYQKKQTIDFEELTNAVYSVFFWSCWFWKSSVLEWFCFIW